jgi:hypothetical protein
MEYYITVFMDGLSDQYRDRNEGLESQGYDNDNDDDVGFDENCDN